MKKLSERIPPSLWEALCKKRDKRIAQLEAENERLREGVQSAMNELGVPNAGYPSPIVEAYEILDALKEGDEPFVGGTTPTYFNPQREADDG